MSTITPAVRPRFCWPTAIAIGAIHLAPLGALWTGIHWSDFGVCVLLYYVRGLCITGGYHRCLSHCSYQLPYCMQLLVGIIGASAVQGGPIKWALHHRYHHLHSDQEDDLHSPIRGFWWAHIGWLLHDEPASIDSRLVKDLLQCRLLRWVDRFHYLFPILLGAWCWWLGPSVLFVGFFLSTVILWHSTWSVNSFTHIVGRREFATPDTSRNSVVVGAVTLGEGSGHNTHHQWPASVRVGFQWWDFDFTYYAIRTLAWLGLASNLNLPSVEVMERLRIKHGQVDLGILQARWQRASRALARLHHKAQKFCHGEAVALEVYIGQMRERWNTAIRNHPQLAVLEGILEAMYRKRLEIASLLKRRTAGYA